MRNLDPVVMADSVSPGVKDDKDGMVKSEILQSPTVADSVSAMEEDKDGKKIFRCKICNKTFKFNNGLVRHVRLIHVGEKPFECNICKKRFGYKHTLMEHQNLHYGNKPYVCLVCNKRFAARSNWVMHRSVHKKPFSCTICAKHFDSEPQLKKHLFAHPQVMLHCSICSFTAPTPSQLNQHIMELHPPQFLDTTRPNRHSTESAGSRESPPTSGVSPELEEQLQHVSTSEQAVLNAVASVQQAVASGQTFPPVTSGQSFPYNLHISQQQQQQQQQQHQNQQQQQQQQQPAASSAGTRIDNIAERLSATANASSSSSSRPDIDHTALNNSQNSLPMELTVKKEMEEFEDGGSTNHNHRAELEGGVDAVQKHQQHQQPLVNSQHQHHQQHNHHQQHHQNQQQQSQHQQQQHQHQQNHQQQQGQGTPIPPPPPRSTPTGDGVIQRTPLPGIDAIFSKSRSTNVVGIPQAPISNPVQNLNFGGLAAAFSPPGLSPGDQFANQRTLYSRDLYSLGFHTNPLSPPLSIPSSHALTTLGDPRFTVQKEVRDVAIQHNAQPPEFPDLDDVIDHYVMQGRIFKCEHCNILFFERGIYYLHASLHSPTNPWECNICHKMCSDRNEFTLHFVNQQHTNL
ncbi:zinc finger protein squeeze isoform X3 [Lingula anatina]|uniref:Zinc finger protein squeeze isoform X3 n=1 Tax=Lingula anatina TaxID=7574 RepID=A0A1S3H1H1_LINAN|nr:zinc finger protein squeeze isoform X3 [Lingula anatina]|eukprot:XP_013379858.1 zinc finger protein squeeze isoform X3 [Lingula anatina]